MLMNGGYDFRDLVCNLVKKVRKKINHLEFYPIVTFDSYLPRLLGELLVCLYRSKLLVFPIKKKLCFAL